MGRVGAATPYKLVEYVSIQCRVSCHCVSMIEASDLTPKSARYSRRVREYGKGKPKALDLMPH